jgi:hypothetical protein
VSGARPNENRYLNVVSGGCEHVHECVDAEELDLSPHEIMSRRLLKIQLRARVPAPTGAQLISKVLGGSLL